jgi:serine/threonine protein kinase
MKARPSAFPLARRPLAEVLDGRYRLGEKIGSGGAAEVYEAVDLRLKREVAVKVFRPGADPALAERCTDEAILLAGLQHPGLVTLYDAGRHDDRAYLVMQLVKGPTLAQRISAGVMEPACVARIGTVLARALAHVHAAGIVHRDVKPSNVLLDGGDAPYLADFGISRMMNATRQTASGALLGTAAYLAPEQVLGKEVGPPADIYTLGLVLLECLKGELEYGGTPLEAAVARLHRPPVIPESVPPRLAELLHAMTALEDKARPGAEQCAEALSALSGQALMPTLATAADPYATDHCEDAGRSGARVPGKEAGAPTAAGPGIRQRIRRPVSGRRPLMVTGTAVLTALLGATLAISPEGNSDDRAAPHSLAPTPVQTPSRTASPEGRHKVGGQPTESPSAASSMTPRSTTPKASGRGTGASPSGPGAGTSAEREDAPGGRTRPDADRAGDGEPSEKATKPKGRMPKKKRS